MRLYDLTKYSCQACDDEGLTTLAIDEHCSILLVGGSKGHVRIVDLKLLLLELNDPEKQGNITIKKLWRAHMLPIASISYVRIHNIILSASKDGCVRLWTMDGSYK
jgi:WD40 repeat protein